MARHQSLDLPRLLGFDLADTSGGAGRLVDGLIAELVERRDDARGRRDFETSARIRERLHKLGVELADPREGTRWHIARR